MSSGSPSRPSQPAGYGTSLSRNTAVMAAGTLLSRLTGFARLVALAYALGFSRLTDTYNLANVTPNIVYELVLGGVLSATLVPVFVDRLSRDDDEEAWRAISAVVTAATAVLVVLTVAFFLLAPVLIRLYTLGNDTGSAGDQRAVATTLLRMFAPQVAFYGMVTVTTAVLHARRRFAAPMFTPVLNNLVVIGVLLALPHVADRLSLRAMRGQAGALALLGLGTTSGVVAMALALLPALRHARVRLRPVWAPGHEAVRAELRLSGWTFGFVAANQVTLWIVLVLANGRRGDVSAYQAGQIFFLLPHGVFAVSVMSALLPDLSEDWARRDVDGYRRGIGVGLRTIATVMVPAAVGYICLARPIVTVALEHGALEPSSAATTATVLALLAVGLPGFSAYLFLTRAYQAMQDTRAMFFLYLVENTINVVVALALYPVMKVGGLALAYAVAYTGGTAVALAHLGRRIGGVEAVAVVRSWLRVLVASAAMASAVVAVAVLVEPDLLEVVTAVVTGAAVYVLAARALGVEEVSALLRFGRRVA